MVTSATARDSFDLLAERSAASLKPIGLELRKLILRVDPTATQIVWPKLKIASFGIGPKKNSQHYVYLSFHAAHINIGFYHGASLKSPGLRLEGTGKNLRHIKVTDSATLRKAALRSLIGEALRERRNRAPAA